MKYLFEAKLDKILKKENAVWVEIARTGEWNGYQTVGAEKQKVVISEKTLDEMISNFENPDITNQNRIDIHLSHPGSPDYQPGAVGWITKLEKREGKLFALLNFLEDFAKEVRAGKWLGFSIEALSNAVHPLSGEAIGAYLTGLGVTNRPFIRGMEFPGLSQINRNDESQTVYLSCNQEDSISMTMKTENEKVDEVKAAEGVAVEPTTETETETEVEVEASCALCDALKKALGKPEASVDDLAGMIASMLAPKEEPAKAEAIQASQLSMEAQVVAMNIQLAQLQEEAKSAKEKLAAYETKEIETSVSEAIKAGRILAGQKDSMIRLASLDKEVFTSLVNAPAKLALGQMLPSKVESAKTEADLFAESIISKARNKK